jgi:hypothetical protein
MADERYPYADPLALGVRGAQWVGSPIWTGTPRGQHAHKLLMRRREQMRRGQKPEFVDALDSESPTPTMADDARSWADYLGLGGLTDRLGSAVEHGLQPTPMDQDPPGPHGPDPMTALSGAESLYRTDDPGQAYRYGRHAASPEALALKRRMLIKEGGTPGPEAPATPASESMWPELIPGLRLDDALAAPVRAIRRGFEPSAAGAPGRATPDDLQRARMHDFMTRYPELAAQIDPGIRRMQAPVVNPMDATRHAETVTNIGPDSSRRELMNVHAGRAARLAAIQRALQHEAARRRLADLYAGQ